MDYRADITICPFFYPCPSLGTGRIVRVVRLLPLARDIGHENGMESVPVKLPVFFDP